jgi:hypothetical protein
MEILNLSHFKEQLEHEKDTNLLYAMSLTSLSIDKIAVNLIPIPIDKPEEMQLYEYLEHRGLYPVVKKIN